MLHEFVGHSYLASEVFPSSTKIVDFGHFKKYYFGTFEEAKLALQQI